MVDLICNGPVTLSRGFMVWWRGSACCGLRVAWKCIVTCEIIHNSLYRQKCIFRTCPIIHFSQNIKKMYKFPSTYFHFGWFDCATSTDQVCRPASTDKILYIFTEYIKNCIIGPHQNIHFRLYIKKCIISAPETPFHRFPPTPPSKREQVCTNMCLHVV